MEDDAFDLYDDLEEFDYKVKYEESENQVKELKRKLDEALKKITLLEEQKSELQSKIDNLERSFQSLLLTARSEIKRKDAQIADVRKERDDLVFRRQKQTQFNKQNQFRTNAKLPDKSDTITKLTNDMNNKNENINKDNENKIRENPAPKNYDHNENQHLVIERIKKLPTVESSTIKHDDTNRCENQIDSHKAYNDKVENKSDLQLNKPEKSIPEYKSRSRSHETPRDRETNIQNNDEANIQKGTNHGSRLDNHTEDKCKDKNDHKRNDFRRHSPSTSRIDNVRRRNSKDSNDRRNEHHSYRESREHRERGYYDRDRRNTDRERVSRDHERGNNYREKENNDRDKQNNNGGKVNIDLDRRKSNREEGNKDRERGTKDRKQENERDKANNDRERGNNDRERRNNDREKETNREKVNNDRDRRYNDRERGNKGREIKNNARENDNHDKINNDRDRRNTDRNRGIDRDEGNNARDRRYNDRDRNRVRQTDRHRELSINKSEYDHHKIDRDRERNKDKNPSNSNENRIHNQEREKTETKKIESRKNLEYKLNVRDNDLNDKLDPIPGRSLRESNKKEKDLTPNRRNDSEVDRRRNDKYYSHCERNGILEENHESKHAGRKRQRDDKPTKEKSEPNKSSPSKKRKYAERKQDQIKSKDVNAIETIEPDAIDSFSEDHLEALKRQLEMQLNGEISNDAKFSSEEDEIPGQSDVLVELTSSSNSNTNAKNDFADAENDSEVKSSTETNDIKNITNESDYTQVDMEIEPPRSVQIDVASENLILSPVKKIQQEVEEIIPLCKKKRAMSTLNAIERSEDKKGKNAEPSDTVDVKSHDNHEKLDKHISDGSNEINSDQIKEHPNEEAVNLTSLIVSTESSEKLDDENPAANGVEQKQSKDIDDDKKKPSPCKTNNNVDDSKQVIPNINEIVNVSNSHETTLNEFSKQNNHQCNDDNTEADAAEANQELDISQINGEECKPKIVDQSTSTNTNNEKKETYRGSFSETSSDFSPKGISSDSSSDDQSSSAYTTHSSSSQSHSEDEQEKKNFKKTSPQMLKETHEPANMPNLDASIDTKHASAGNHFQSPLENPKNDEESEDEVFETPIKPPRHVKTYRIQQNDDAQTDTVGKIVIVNTAPSKIVQEKRVKSKTPLKRKRENESNESSIKRSKNDVDSDKKDKATAIKEMKFDSLSTNQLDALEKQLAFEVYGENIYEETTIDIKKEQNNQSLNLSNDSIFGSNELNSSADRILTNDNEANKIDSDRDKLGHRILKEIGLEESEQNVESSDHKPNEEETQTINTEFMHHSQNSALKQNAEVDKRKSVPCLPLPEVKFENQSNTSNQSTESAEVEILGTIEILPSKSHDIQDKTAFQIIKGPQKNTRRKSTEISQSNQLKTVSPDVGMNESKVNKKSSQTAANSKIKKAPTSKDPPAKRGTRPKVNDKPKTIGNEEQFALFDLDSLKESNRIISKTKDGIWLKCDCVSTECLPIADKLLTPFPDCQPGALGVPLPGNVTSKEDATVTSGKLLEENKSKQKKTKLIDSPDSQPGALGIPLSGNVTSKEDATVIPGKLLEENKSKQKKTKLNDSPDSQPGALGIPLPGNVTSKEDATVTPGKLPDENKPKQRKTKLIDSPDSQPRALGIPLPGNVTSKEDATLIPEKLLEENKFKQRKTKLNDSPDCQPGALGIPLPGNVTSKEDATATPGKLLEDNKSKQRKTKSNDNQQSTKSTIKSKSNVKMIGHIIEGFEREPSPSESKLDTSRDLKHELFKEALGVTSSTPYKSDISGASKVSDSSSNESLTETTEKKISDDLDVVKSKSKSKTNNQVNNLNIKGSNEKISNSKPSESTEKECNKEEITADNVDPVSSFHKVPDIKSSENMSAQIEILNVQIIQGCALNKANDELKCEEDLTNIPKEIRKPMSCKNIEKLKDEPTTDVPSKQDPVDSRNRLSKTKGAASQIETPLKNQEKQKDAPKPAKKTEKNFLSKESSSSAKVPTKNPKSSDSSKRRRSSNNSETIPQSKDCDILKPTPEHVQTLTKYPAANAVETLASTEHAPLTPEDPCPSTPSVAKLAKIPTCNESSPNTSILSRSQHEKRNISIASTDYVIEKVDNNVVNVFITRKKVKKKKKV